MHITGGAFVQPGPGDVDCGGVDTEHGCVHLQALAKERKAEVKRVNDLAEAAFAAEHKQEFERMRDGIVAGVGSAVGIAMADHLGRGTQRSDASKQRLRDGKGDE